MKGKCHICEERISKGPKYHTEHHCNECHYIDETKNEVGSKSKNFRDITSSPPALMSTPALVSNQKQGNEMTRKQELEIVRRLASPTHASQGGLTYCDKATSQTNLFTL